MGVLEQPGAVGQALGAHQLDRLIEPRVPDVGPAEVLQPTQDVVVPAGRERELAARRRPAPGRCSCAGTASARAGTARRGGGQRASRPSRPLPARARAGPRARRSSSRTTTRWRRPLGLAVPAAVLELIGEQASDDAVDVGTEVGAEGHRVAVDAGFDLAVEERQVVVLPAAVRGHQRGHLPSGLGCRVQPEGVELQHHRQRRRPGLAAVLGAFGEVETLERVAPAGEAGTAQPLTIRVTSGQQTRTPALVRHPPALSHHVVSRRAGQIAHDLPPDRRIGVEQPLQHRNRRHGPDRRLPRVVSHVRQARSHSGRDLSGN